MKSAHAVNAAEREFETLRFMRSEERGIFGEPCKKNARLAGSAGCCAKSSRLQLARIFVAINISSDEETSVLPARLPADLDERMRACWYVFGMREGYARDPRNHPPPPCSTSWLACTESVHEILRVRKLPQGASFTTKLETYADSGPNGRAGRRAGEYDTLTHILFSAPRRALWKKVRIMPAGRRRNEHFIESEGAAINVSFTLLANFSFCRKRNFISLSSSPFMLKLSWIIPIIRYRRRNQNGWNEIRMITENSNDR